MTIVRKFRIPQDKQEQAERKLENSARSDLDIPEINTNFMDNLFHDPAFLDRFDASYEKTSPMGIDGDEVNDSSGTLETENMMEFDFQSKSKS